MQIREASLADGAGIGKVQLESWRTMFPDSGVQAQEYLEQFSVEERTEDWHELLSQLPSAQVVFVAVNDESQIIGFALGELHLAEEDAYSSELSVVHLLPAYRNQGIGTKLIGIVAQHLKDNGATSLCLWTLAGNPARRLYERLGGQQVGEQTKIVGKNEIGVEITEVSYGWKDVTKLIDSCLK